MICGNKTRDRVMEDSRHACGTCIRQWHGIRFNRQKIKEAGYSDVTVCVITDGADEKTVHFHTGIYAQENETVIIEIE